jgi:DNA-binding response OmpR family regulator
MMVFASGITSEDCPSSTDAVMAAQAVRRSGLAKCLVVSGNDGLRHRLGAVADLSGWEEFDLPETAADLAAAIDSDYQLVVVDVAGPLGDRVNDSVEVIEEFAARAGTLLVVCGSGDSVDEELWARQIGAWVYLPGVSNGDALVSLFTDARRLSERRVEHRWSSELMKHGV